jgi:serine protease Do
MSSIRSKNATSSCVAVHKTPLRNSLLKASAAVIVIASGLALGLVSPTLAQKTPDAMARGPMAAGTLSFADLVERVKPSVVSISVRQGGDDKVAQAQPKGGRRGAPGQAPGIPGLPDDHPLNEFFRNLPQDPRGGQGGQPKGMAQGSGFIISEDGLVVTNNHVIDGAGKITVQFDNDEKLEATLVGTDPRTDIALLKIKAPGRKFPAVKFAGKEGRVGDWVLAVGNPFGLGGTVTAGIISALTRDIGSGPYDYIQIDASVNRGNSGGPTFNLDGDVIGINTAIYSPSGGSVGIAFAVPAKTAITVIEQLKATGSVSRGWLGVQIQSVDEDVAASVGLAEAKGAMVSVVTPKGPAEASGLKVQDTILSVNGQKINDSRDLARRIAEFSPNTTVDVKVLRNGREQIVPVKLGTFPKTTDEVAKVDDNKVAPSAGTELGSLGLTLGTKATKEGGVAITEISDSSDASQKGLRVGDVIIDVNGTSVATAADVEAQVKVARDAKRAAVLLNVRRGGTTQIVAVRLSAKG